MPRYWITIVTWNLDDNFYSYIKELPDDVAASNEVGLREGWYVQIGDGNAAIEEAKDGVYDSASDSITGSPSCALAVWDAMVKDYEGKIYDGMFIHGINQEPEPPKDENGFTIYESGSWDKGHTVSFEPLPITDQSAALRLRSRVALELAKHMDNGDTSSSDDLLRVWRWLNAIAEPE